MNWVLCRVWKTVQSTMFIILYKPVDFVHKASAIKIPWKHTQRQYRSSFHTQSFLIKSPVLAWHSWEMQLCSVMSRFFVAFCLSFIDKIYSRKQCRKLHIGNYTTKDMENVIAIQASLSVFINLILLRNTIMFSNGLAFYSVSCIFPFSYWQGTKIYTRNCVWGIVTLE